MEGLSEMRGIGFGVGSGSGVGGKKRRSIFILFVFKCSYFYLETEKKADRLRDAIVDAHLLGQINHMCLLSTTCSNKYVEATRIRRIEYVLLGEFPVSEIQFPK